jgi:hypothetical protein
LTEEEIRKLLSTCGIVEDVRLVPPTEGVRGFCIVAREAADGHKKRRVQ